MNYLEKFKNVEIINQALGDEESRKMFEARLEYLCTRDERKYISIVNLFEKDWSNVEFANFSEDDLKKIIIYGCGYDGRANADILRKCGIEPLVFCVSDIAQEEKVDGLSVISLMSVLERYSDCFILVSSRKYKEEMLKELHKNNFPSKQIIVPQYGPTITAKCGNQYFDMFEPENEEMFVDCGAYNGETTIEFAKWAKDKYKKSYLIEPINEMRSEIEKNLNENDIKNYALVSGAAWCKNENVYFNFNENNDRASTITQDKGECIQGVSIDEITRGEKVTFIKMDIEGSELMALQGASETIKKWKPKLAISLYHKAKDVIEIPYYILELVPDYKLFIRHYTCNMGETVLYAICN